MTSPTTTTPSPVSRAALAASPAAAGRQPPKKHQHSLALRLKRSWRLYVLLLPPFIYGILFMWAPLYGLQMAFKDFSVALGINGSPWAGLRYLEQFVNSFQFGTVIRNSLVLNFYELIALFPLPIVLALLLNVVRNMKFKRSVQLITYAPYFISTVVVVGIIIMLFSPSGGIVNQVIVALGGAPTDFLSSSLFRHTYVWSGAWQTLGYSAIIYLAALAGIDPELHEAAKVDGASIVRRIRHIDLPGILPVMVTLLILNMGSMLSVGFEKVLLMQTPLNLNVSEVIDTYSYNVAFASSIPQYSYAAAIGLFKSVIAVIMLVLANWLARRVAKTSLF